MIKSDFISLRHEFSHEAEHERKLRDWLREQRRQQKIQRQEDAEQAEAELLTIGQAAIEATFEEIAAFDAKLTKYEALTIEEINFLRDRLDALMEERQRLLDNAHVLADGTRVFKTEDGTKVFDQHGNEIGRDVVDPAEIGNDKPSWETWKSVNEEISATDNQLNAAHDFQSKLDDIRERFDRGDITKDELKELESELEKSVPLSLRTREVELQLDDARPEAKPEFAAAAQNKVNIDTLELDAPSLDQ